MYMFSETRTFVLYFKKFFHSVLQLYFKIVCNKDLLTSGFLLEVSYAYVTFH